jgi:hypothetical protein
MTFVNPEAIKKMAATETASSKARRQSLEGPIKRLVERRFLCREHPTEITP